MEPSRHLTGGLSNDFSLFRSLIESFLGPSKSTKCVVDDSEVQLVSCPVSFLQAIYLKEPIEHVIHGSLQAQHNSFGCGTNTLLAMWYFWHQHFKELVEKGHQLSRVLDIARKVLDHILLKIDSFKIPLMSLLQLVEVELQKFSKSFHLKQTSTYSVGHKTSCYSGFPKHFCQPSTSGVSTKNKGVSRTLLSSRHYPSICLDANVDVPVDNENNMNLFTKETGLKLTSESRNVLHSFVKKINHGADHLSDVLCGLWQHQVEVMHKILFDSGCLSVYNFLGPVSKSSVLHGLLLKAEDWCLFPEKFHKPKALFITGAIKMEYVHLGFSPCAQVQSKKSVSELGEQKLVSWITQCSELLQMLQITILFVQGSVDPAFMQYCVEHSISVLGDVPWQKFKLLTSQGQWQSSVYLLDCSESDVITDLEVKIWKSTEIDEFKSLQKQCFNFILVSPQSQHVLQTALLYHPSPSMHSVLEHQFWHSVSKLHLSTKAGAILPGSGRTETWCMKLLQDFSHTLEEEDEKEIISAMSSGFSSFCSILSSKSFCHESEAEECLDEMSSKVQAWNASLALAFITLSADSQFCIQSMETHNEEIYFKK